MMPTKKNLLNQTRSCISLLCCLGLCQQIAQAKDDILLGDFEDGSYQGWTLEGDAFGEAPASGKIGNQGEVTGFVGSGLVNTYLKGDGSQGTLTSPSFTIEHDYLRFLQGGGYWKHQTTIELLVDETVVDATVGRNSSKLEAKVFDLREWQGKTAQVRIADRTGRGWGFVVADQFILTNTIPEGVRMPSSRTLTIEGTHLRIPIDNSDLHLELAPYLTVKLGETLLYRGKAILADNEDEISWWAHLSVPEAVGKEVTLEYANELDSEALELVDSSDDMRAPELYNEALRPQLRFSQRFGWSNDPNGMLYYDGEYHLFFQSNPLGINWANMFWGHAVSKDLIHWEERSYALRPWAEEGKHHPAMSPGMCFSGGGAVDFNNTLGLQPVRQGSGQAGDTKTLFATFTAKYGGGERIATSTDKGASWQVGDVLFQHNGRDPKPFWYEPGQHWVIAIYNEHKERGGRNISIYTSTDLKHWEYQSAVPGFYECPELFELPVHPTSDTRSPTSDLPTRWVLMGANAKYLVGTFDGKVFTPEHEEQKETIVGKIKTAIYAGQCFSNTPDGRVIYIGWAGMGGQDKKSPFHHGFTLPIHLTLVASPDGPRLNAKPIEELDQLRADKAFSVTATTLNETNPALSTQVPTQEVDIVLKLNSANQDGQATLRLGQTRIPVDVTSGSVDIRVICDRPFMEVITDNGSRYEMINRRDRGQPLGEIALEHVEGSIEIEAFTVYTMQSIWD
jgi:fructan beta-fructosidase